MSDSLAGYLMEAQRRFGVGLEHKDMVIGALLQMIDEARQKVRDLAAELKAITPGPTPTRIVQNEQLRITWERLARDIGHQDKASIAAALNTALAEGKDHG